MEAFNPLWINRYSQVELLAFLASGYTLDDFKMCGLTEDNLQALSAVMESAKAINDDTIFAAARNENTLNAYGRYLDLMPNGKHIEECKACIRRHKSMSEHLTQSLIEDMKAHPKQYGPYVLRLLIEGLDQETIEDYKLGIFKQEDMNPLLWEILIEGHSVDMDKVAQSVKPHGMSENTWRTIWTKPDYPMPSPTAKEMSRMLKWGNDVFMLGIYGCGRTSLTAAILNYSALFLNGTYQPHSINGEDASFEDYRALRDIIPACKFPEPQASTEFCFIHYTAMGQKATFIHHAGEMCNLMVQSRNSTDCMAVWEVNALRACLEDDNDKTLFFLIDCGVLLGGDVTEYYTAAEQALMLENMLQILCSNGPNQQKPKKGCSMSWVKKLAIVFTKADLLPGEPSVSNWLKQCETHMNEYYRSFLMELNHACKMYNINKKNQHQPYVFAHSIGEPFVGQCFCHKVETTKAIAKFIFET